MTSINEEIQQKKFANEYTKLSINVLFTSSWLNGLHNSLLKEHKLTQQQFNTLRILRGQHPNAACVNLIKDRMIDKMSNVSRIIDKLKAKALVTRKTCKGDRRQVDIAITQKGLDLLIEIDKDLKPFESKLHNISEEEAVALNGLLDKWRG
ncbi:MAG: MarR family transcriptional regulator [Flavobacteriales bacterium]|jgi:DNA-binding MarR family transcriptional regulator|nr:MarR family transcriptional regulator [Flavobacteriales bacterium]NCG28985.1 MarR family transcriptional regulator [Bacteroidota bacterium]MBT3963709.1 MarR family transcriptional regulator [Flavobacteriales bacterium]MBT4706009.1 MarR family transcriptional regulator [Flavobacteriales bacterium]MBT4931469.1 MarR family transcriptional regulator [Flavobacteriales bacterium]